MKKTSLFSVIVALGIVLSFTANATGLSKEFSNFEITPVDDLHLGKKVQKVWTLAYSQNETPITVVKTKNVDGVNYVVRSDFFEVTYLSSAQGFGATEIKKHWRNVPKQISDAVINRNELEKQGILTPNQVDDETALGLIAGFLPQLINEGYTHLLN